MAPIVIQPKDSDTSTTFSVRVQKELVATFDRLSQKTGRSRNELINMAMRYFADNAVIAEPKSQYDAGGEGYTVIEPKSKNP